MSEKKYYWLKLKRDFFKRHDIKIIEAMDNGKDYILFYLKLLCESVDHQGNLRFNEQIPYSEKMLATITNTNIDIVKNAMECFISLKMIDILDDKTIFMAEVDKLIGSETYWAEAKRKQRVGQCQDNVLLMSNMSNQEIDIDKELDIDKEIDINKKVNKKDELLAMLAATQFSEPIKKSLTDWLNYKEYKYKKQGFESLLTIVLKKISIYGETAICDLITECMGNLWKGIIWEKLEKKSYKKADNPLSSGKLDYSE